MAIQLSYVPRTEDDPRKRIKQAGRVRGHSEPGVLNWSLEAGEE